MSHLILLGFPHRSLQFLAGAALLLAAAVPALGQQTVEAPDVQALGPQVGTRVPPFSLQDQDGNVRTLESLMGPEGLMLVFARSADW